MAIRLIFMRWRSPILRYRRRGANPWRKLRPGLSARRETLNAQGRKRRNGRSVRDGFEVFPQQIAPKVAVEVPPNRVDVVAVVLRVVVLDEEGRPLDSV